MSSLKDRLCIITPDSFYGVLLNAAEFPTFATKVIRGTEHLSALAVNFIPDAFLVFADHLGPVAFSKTVLDLRSKFPNAHLFQLEDSRAPKLSSVNHYADEPFAESKMYSVRSIADLDTSMRRVLDPALRRFVGQKSPTKTQLEVLEALALGSSNADIAETRGTTTRAAEMIIQRAFKAIGATNITGARARMLAAQQYLAS